MYFSYPSYQFLRYICVTQCDGVSNLQGLSCHTVVYVLCEWQVLVQKFTVMLHVWCAFLHSWLSDFLLSEFHCRIVHFISSWMLHVPDFHTGVMVLLCSLFDRLSVHFIVHMVPSMAQYLPFSVIVVSYTFYPSLTLANPPTPKCFIAVLPISVQWWTFNMICRLWTTEYLNESIMLFLAIPCVMHASFSICPWQVTMYT